MSIQCVSCWEVGSIRVQVHVQGGGGPGIPPLTPSLSPIPTPHNKLLAVYMTERTLNLAAKQSTTSYHQSLVPSSTPTKKTANLIALNQ